MRREGRTHGMVRTVTILPNSLHPIRSSRIINSPPTAGIFIKVPSKPTNHSRFTSQNERPTPKSKDKSKGTQKLKSLDGKLSCKGINWSVMSTDRSDKIPVVGYSATQVLHDVNYFRDSDAAILDDYDNYDYEDENEDDVDDGNGNGNADGDGDGDDDVIVHGGVMDDGDDGYQGFYDISSVFGVVVDDEDEDWYIVGEI